MQDSFHCSICIHQGLVRKIEIILDISSGINLVEGAWLHFLVTGKSETTQKIAIVGGGGYTTPRARCVTGAHVVEARTRAGAAWQKLGPQKVGAGAMEKVQPLPEKPTKADRDREKYMSSFFILSFILLSVPLFPFPILIFWK